MQRIPFVRAPLDRLVIVLACLASGCAGWSTIPRPAPAEFEARKVVQVWTGPTAMTLREVVVGSDSVSGVRTDRYPICDSCRVSIAQTEIDSFRIKPVDSSNNFGSGMLIGLVTGAVVTWAVLLASFGGT